MARLAVLVHTSDPQKLVRSYNEAATEEFGEAPPVPIDGQDALAALAEATGRYAGPQRDTMLRYAYKIRWRSRAVKIMERLREKAKEN